MKNSKNNVKIEEKRGRGKPALAMGLKKTPFAMVNLNDGERSTFEALKQKMGLNSNSEVFATLLKQEAEKQLSEVQEIPFKNQKRDSKGRFLPRK